jgi:putative endonuclease
VLQLILTSIKKVKHMSRAKGNLAEDKANEFLLASGYRVLERNFYSRFGEIDIIALKDEVLHFVEVKSGLDYESAVQNITPKKLSRLIKTAHVYMKKNSLELDFMIDALIITPKNIELIGNITI